MMVVAQGEKFLNNTVRYRLCFIIYFALLILFSELFMVPNISNILEHNLFHHVKPPSDRQLRFAQLKIKKKLDGMLDGITWSSSTKFKTKTQLKLVTFRLVHLKEYRTIVSIISKILNLIIDLYS